MRNLQICITAAMMLTSLCLFTCSEEKDYELIPVNLIDPDTISFVHSMKGWELYSWPNGDDWNYTLLIGTNRTKTYDEVTKNRIIVTGTDSLKLLLSKFPENENIFWVGQGWLESCWGSDFGNLSLPGKKIILEISDYCNQKNLVLRISK